MTAPIVTNTMGNRNIAAAVYSNAGAETACAVPEAI